MLYSKMVKTFILVTVRPSMYSCRMMGFRNVLTMLPEKGSFDPHASRRFETDVGKLSGLG